MDIILMEFWDDGTAFNLLVLSMFGMAISSLLDLGPLLVSLLGRH
jgi:hypothetical protein